MAVRRIPHEPVAEDRIVFLFGDDQIVATSDVVGFRPDRSRQSRVVTAQAVHEAAAIVRQLELARRDGVRAFGDSLDRRGPSCAESDDEVGYAHLLQGGDEDELVPLEVDLAPESATLAVRGSIQFDGGFAFFHRLPDRSIDEGDIASRAAIPADFIKAANTQYGLPKAPIAIGFSNGAIMAAALLLTRPGLLAGAILFRPLLSFRMIWLPIQIAYVANVW
jgi:hypothetical protein